MGFEVGEQDWRWLPTRAWYQVPSCHTGGAPAGRATLEQGIPDERSNPSPSGRGTRAVPLRRHAFNEETDYPTLLGAVTVDIAIIGGGFTGVATAVELAERGSR